MATASEEETREDASTAMSLVLDRCRRLQNELSHIRLEINDNEARNKCWKSVISDECKANETTYQSKMVAVHSKFNALSEDIKACEASCRSHVEKLHFRTLQLQKEQSESFKKTEADLKQHVDGLREETNKVFKDHTARVWKENAQLAESFVERTDRLKQLVEDSCRNLEERAVVTSHQQKKDLQDNIQLAVAEQKQTSDKSLESGLDRLQEYMESHVAAAVAERKAKEAELEKAVNSRMREMRTELEDSFLKRMDARVHEVQESFLQGMDRLENWLTEQKMQTDSDIAQLEARLVNQSAEITTAQERHDKNLEETESKWQLKVDELLERCKAHDDSFEEKDQELKRVRENFEHAQQRMAKNYLLLHMQFESLKSNFDQQGQKYTECIREYERTGVDLSKRLKTQEETFQSYENTVLQHAADFQVFMDEHSTDRAEIDDMIQSWTAEIDELGDQIRSCTKQIDVAREDLDLSVEEQKAHFNALTNMSETWEKLYEHLAAQVLENDNSRKQDKRDSEKAFDAFKEKVTALTFEVSETLESLEQHKNEHAESIKDLKNQAAEQDSELGDIVDDLAELRTDTMNLLLKQSVEHNQGLEQIQKETTGMQQTLDFLGDKLDKSVELLSVELSERALVSDVKEYMDSQGLAFDTLSQKVAEQKDGIGKLRQEAKELLASFTDHKQGLGDRFSEMTRAIKEKASVSLVEETAKNQHEETKQLVLGVVETANEQGSSLEEIQAELAVKTTELENVKIGLEALDEGKEAIEKTVEVATQRIEVLEKDHIDTRSMMNQSSNNLKDTIDQLRNVVDEKTNTDAVKQIIHTETAGLTDQVQLAHQQSEKHRVMAKKLQSEVDKYGLKIDVLQTNLGTVNITMFRELANKVNHQVRSLHIDRQITEKTCEEVSELAEKVESRLSDTSLQKKMEEICAGFEDTLQAHKTETRGKLVVLLGEADQQKLRTDKLESKVATYQGKLEETQESLGNFNRAAFLDLSQRVLGNADRLSAIQKEQREAKLSFEDAVTKTQRELDTLLEDLKSKASATSVEECFSLQRQVIDDRLKTVDHQTQQLSSKFDETNTEMGRNRISFHILQKSLDATIQKIAEITTRKLTKQEKLLEALGQRHESVNTEMAALKDDVDRELDSVARYLDEKVSQSSFSDQLMLQYDATEEMYKQIFDALDQQQFSLEELQQDIIVHSDQVKALKKDLGPCNRDTFGGLSKFVAQLADNVSDLKANGEKTREELTRTMERTDRQTGALSVISELQDSSNEQIAALENVSSELNQTSSHVDAVRDTFGEWNEEKLNILKSHLLTQISESSKIQVAIESTQQQVAQLGQEFSERAPRLNKTEQDSSSGVQQDIEYNDTKISAILESIETDGRIFEKASNKCRFEILCIKKQAGEHCEDSLRIFSEAVAKHTNLADSATSCIKTSFEELTPLLKAQLKRIRERVEQGLPPLVDTQVALSIDSVNKKSEMAMSLAQRNLSESSRMQCDVDHFLAELSLAQVSEQADFSDFTTQLQKFSTLQSTHASLYDAVLAVMDGVDEDVSDLSAQVEQYIAARGFEIDNAVTRIFQQKYSSVEEKVGELSDARVQLATKMDQMHRDMVQSIAPKLDTVEQAVHSVQGQVVALEEKMISDKGPHQAVSKDISESNKVLLQSVKDDFDGLQGQVAALMDQVDTVKSTTQVALREQSSGTVAAINEHGASLQELRTEMDQSVVPKLASVESAIDVLQEKIIKLSEHASAKKTTDVSVCTMDDLSSVDSTKPVSFVQAQKQSSKKSVIIRRRLQLKKLMELSNEVKNSCSEMSVHDEISQDGKAVSRE